MEFSKKIKEKKMIRLFAFDCNGVLHVNARFCPTCETAEDFRKAKFLAENLLISEQGSGEKQQTTAEKRHKLNILRGESLYTKEKNSYDRSRQFRYSDSIDNKRG